MPHAWSKPLINVKDFADTSRGFKEVVTEVVNDIVDSVKPECNELEVLLFENLSAAYDHGLKENPNMPSIYKLTGQKPTNAPWRLKCDLDGKKLSLLVAPPVVSRDYSLEALIAGLAHEISEYRVITSKEYQKRLVGERLTLIDHFIYSGVRDRFADEVSARCGYAREQLGLLPKWTSVFIELSKQVFNQESHESYVVNSVRAFGGDKSVSLETTGHKDIAKIWRDYVSQHTLNSVPQENALKFLKYYSSFVEEVLSQELSFISLWDIFYSRL